MLVQGGSGARDYISTCSVCMLLPEENVLGAVTLTHLASGHALSHSLYPRLSPLGRISSPTRLLETIESLGIHFGRGVAVQQLALRVNVPTERRNGVQIRD